ncbi:transport and Golgi organization 2 [Tripterygium wilfordii]|uniref:Transport and Golgi organization 2 n=1 Tax=Tripterygium wilfordii TaxID=458696 RepID=A0A7J7DID6_TRIWF|nr:transport and Golgi organization 2 homolog [Tripterygium wilfordii]KAF5745816.1 transport and Golgi organization 2 [Tripterygium wilfordii]
MCIAVFLWQAHPLYPLILLLNRDEFHNRPTAPLAWWEGGEILGGRDGLAGGTWLACSREGRLAFLTNVREVHQSTPLVKSRGDLPVSFLKSKKNPLEFAEEVLKEADQYNGFNLILVDLGSKSIIYVTNRSKEDKVGFIREVSPGIHVLTNASLDFPWPKAQRLRLSFEELLVEYGENELPLKEMVERLMTDTTKDRSSLPGIYPPEKEYELSSIFVDRDTPLGRYGTRSTSALLVKLGGEVCFYERHLDKDLWKEEMVNYKM